MRANNKLVGMHLEGGGGNRKATKCNSHLQCRHFEKDCTNLAPQLQSVWLQPLLVKPMGDAVQQPLPLWTQHYKRDDLRMA